LLIFLCNHCPYVKHIRTAFAQLTADYAAKGVAIVAIRISGWTRARRPTPPPVDAAMRERIRRELERET
jgi:hypothetical protein